MEPKKTFQNLSKNKQNRIIEAAIEEFSENGFEGASINAMVQRLKIAKGSIFQYFGDKKSLYLYVFNKSVEIVKDYLRTIRDQSVADDFPTRLRKTISSGVGFISSHPLLYRLYLKVLFDSKAPFRNDILLTLRTYSLDYLRSLLASAEEKKELQESLDIDKAAFILDAVMDRFLQAKTTKHLDAKLGIYENNNGNNKGKNNRSTDIWINEIVSILCQGMVKRSNPDIKFSLDSDFSYILVSAAVDEEVAELISKFDRPSVTDIGNRRIVSGQVNNMAVKVIFSGPGIVNTTQALTAIVESDRPGLIIQTGSGGAFYESGLNLGDICIATEEIDIHSGVESLSGHFFIDDLPFALLKAGSGEYKNRFPVEEKLVTNCYQVLKKVLTPLDIKVEKGPFITVSTITASDNRAAALHECFKPAIEQMEGAAAAHISMLYDIPFLEVRSVSNFVGKRDRQNWNLSMASRNCSRAVYELIQSGTILNIKHTSV